MCVVYASRSKRWIVQKDDEKWKKSEDSDTFSEAEHKH